MRAFGLKICQRIGLNAWERAEVAKGSPMPFSFWFNEGRRAHRGRRPHHQVCRWQSRIAYAAGYYLPTYCLVGAAYLIARLT
jgi:hypothetical protein